MLSLSKQNQKTMIKIDWSSWNKPLSKESCINDLNKLLKYKHINKILYKKALFYLQKGYQWKGIAEDKGHYKILKVIKGNKL